uniref:Ankyrin repeat and SAM domain-containing protein 6-like n=1 Tax=Sinocyclocheilus rhinocerous TaxID=307959 RepID=A0A673LJY6_9TELE
SAGLVSDGLVSAGLVSVGLVSAGLVSAGLDWLVLDWSVMDWLVLCVSVMWCCAVGNAQLVKEIVEEDASQVNVSNADGASPLMMAAVSGQLEVVQLLVEKHADMDRQDSVHGWTALMQATYHGCVCHSAGVCQVTFIYTALLTIQIVSKQLYSIKQENTPVLSFIRNKDVVKFLLNPLSTNQLAPFPDEVPLDATMKAEESSAAAAPPAGAPSADVCTAWTSRSKDCGLNGTRSGKDDFLITTMLRNGAPLARLPNEKLKAVIPPFLPPSNFEPWNSERCGAAKEGRSGNMPQRPGRSSCANSDITSISRVVSRSIKFPSITKGPSPSNSGSYNSAHSSGGYNGVAGVNHHASDSHNRSGGSGADSVLSQIVAQRKRAAGLLDSRTAAEMPSPVQMPLPSKLELKKCPQSGNSSTSKSTSPTLTPSPSPTPKPAAADSLSSVSTQPRSKSSGGSSSGTITDEDELSGILRKLSLEKYQSIFEEQEVDMEQILAAICELNAGKVSM